MQYPLKVHPTGNDFLTRLLRRLLTKPTVHARLYGYPDEGFAAICTLDSYVKEWCRMNNRIIC